MASNILTASSIAEKYKCPVTFESMADDAMAIEHCGHHISEPAIKEMIERAGMVYEASRLVAQLQNTLLECPMCRGRITNVHPDHDHRSIIRDMEALAARSHITTPASTDPQEKVATPPAAEQTDIVATAPLENPQQPARVNQAAYQAPAPRPPEPRPNIVVDRPNVNLSNNRRRAELNNFNKTHYGMEWLTYGAMARDILDENDASEQGNCCAAAGFAVLARIRRLFACLVLTPMTTAHGLCCCGGGTCCCCVGTAITAGTCCLAYDWGFVACCMGGVGCCCAALLCCELFQLTLCCPFNICSPECVDNSCEMPKLHRDIERGRHDLSEYLSPWN